MKPMRILLSMVMIGSACLSYAQDKIYKTDGDVISAKIKSIGTRTITYSRFDNQTGPEYTITKNEVTKITYQNGNEDIISELLPMRPHRPSSHSVKPSHDEASSDRKIDYKPNILSLAPIQFSENGLGVGISYERAIDKDGIIAFYIPVLATFNLNNGTYQDANGNMVNGHQDMMLYAMPGIKIYPTGSFGTVRYAVGPSLVVASGEKSSTGYDPSSGLYTSYQTQDHFMLGMVVNNSLNINPNPHVYLGLELGMGFTYLNRVAGLNQDTKFLIQGAFKVGFRF